MRVLSSDWKIFWKKNLRKKSQKIFLKEWKFSQKKIHKKKSQLEFSKETRWKMSFELKIFFFKKIISEINFLTNQRFFFGWMTWKEATIAKILILIHFKFFKTHCLWGKNLFEKKLNFDQLCLSQIIFLSPKNSRKKWLILQSISIQKKKSSSSKKRTIFINQDQINNKLHLKFPTQIFTWIHFFSY